VQKIRVRVYHSSYGCETGCCGHIVELTGGAVISAEKFEFTHPYGENVNTWAREFAEEVIRSEWPECIDAIDWNSMVVEASND
jgi:hypothetical protein